MGAIASKRKAQNADQPEETVTRTGFRRGFAFTEIKALHDQPAIPPGCQKSSESDYEFITEALKKLLLFNNIDSAIYKKIVSDTYERNVKAGEILIKQGDTGQAASELYIVKEGKFEVLEQRQGTMMRVNVKERGDCFGEISLMFDFPRSATVAATTDAVVWVLTRKTTRKHIKDMQQSEYQQSELFLNSVPILNPLSDREKKKLVSALELVTFEAGEDVQSDKGVGVVPRRCCHKTGGHRRLFLHHS